MKHSTPPHCLSCYVTDTFPQHQITLLKSHLFPDIPYVTLFTTLVTLFKPDCKCFCFVCICLFLYNYLFYLLQNVLQGILFSILLLFIFIIVFCTCTNWERESPNLFHCIFYFVFLCMCRIKVLESLAVSSTQSHSTWFKSTGFQKLGIKSLTNTKQSPQNLVGKLITSIGVQGYTLGRLTAATVQEKKVLEFWKVSACQNFSFDPFFIPEIDLFLWHSD